MAKNAYFYYGVTGKNRRNRLSTYGLEGVAGPICWVIRGLWAVFTMFQPLSAIFGLFVSQKRVLERPEMAKYAYFYHGVTGKIA
jgi:hypothetical protein